MVMFESSAPQTSPPLPFPIPTGPLGEPTIAAVPLQTTRHLHTRVNCRLIGRMEPLVRAIAMQFTLGEHADPAAKSAGWRSFCTELRNLWENGFGTIDDRRSVEVLKLRSQLSGLPPNACERRMAISGEIPMRALSSIESVLRETASPFAASVTVSPRGSRHWRRTNAPDGADRA